MKALVAALVLLAFPISASAADPFVGTFRLNPAKSSATGGKTPPEMTLTITEEGTNLLIATSARAADGSAIPADVLAVPKAGGTMKAPQGASYDSTKVTRRDANTIDLVAMQGGKERTKVKFALSKDGKTLTRSFTSTNAQGGAVTGTSVLERE